MRMRSMTGTILDQYFSVCKFMESVNVNKSCMTHEMSVKQEPDDPIPYSKSIGKAEEKVQIQGGEDLGHFCKICNRRFACGRALGGHMRIHSDKSNPRLISTEPEMNGWCESVEGTDPTTNKQTPNPTYALRTSRKRSWVVADQSYSFLKPSTNSSGDAVDSRSPLLFTDSLVGCDECRKEFSSWKSLLAHMKSSHCFEEEKMLETESESVQPQPRVKGKRSKRMKCLLQQDEHYNEEEDMANCLVMLATVGKTSSLEKGKTTAYNRAPSSRDPRDQSKTNGRREYMCKTCQKVFFSFQALGGHRANNHNNNCAASSKIQDYNNSSEEEIITTYEDLFIAEAGMAPQKIKRNEKESAGRKARVHECSICEKKFPSGQALGGHKRCHRTTTPTAAMSSPTLHHTLEEKRALSHEGEFIDLNLPAPGHVDEYEAEYPEKVAAPNNLVQNFSTEINYGKGLLPLYMQPWWSGNRQDGRLFSLHEQTQTHYNIVVGPDDEAESTNKGFT